HPEVGTRPVMMTDRPPVGGRPFAGRVLVVCDTAAEPHVGAQLVALGVAGEAILPIRDVEEAVRTIEGSMPAIAIVDLDVAERTGADAVRRLREAAPRLPLLVLASTEAMASDGLKAGADDYLLKGEYGARDLERAIRYARERRLLRTSVTSRSEKIETAERRFRSLIETSADGILIVDGHGIVRLANERAGG